VYFWILFIRTHVLQNIFNFEHLTPLSCNKQPRELDSEWYLMAYTWVIYIENTEYLFWVTSFHRFCPLFFLRNRKYCYILYNNAILLFIITIVPVRGNNIIFNDLPNTNYQKTLDLPVRTSGPQRSQQISLCSGKTWWCINDIRNGTTCRY